MTCLASKGLTHCQILSLGKVPKGWWSWARYFIYLYEPWAEQAHIHGNFGSGHQLALSHWWGQWRNVPSHYTNFHQQKGGRGEQQGCKRILQAQMALKPTCSLVPRPVLKWVEILLLPWLVHKCSSITHRVFLDWERHHATRCPSEKHNKNEPHYPFNIPGLREALCNKVSWWRTP